LKQAEARALARAIVWAPTSSHAWYYLGRESCRLSFTPASPRYRYGECCLSLAAAYNPHNYRMWYQLGYTRLTAGDLRGADEAFDRALALRPWLRKPEFPKPPEGRR
jgi:tetratricopeptide (TPR) repeat protein